MPDGEIQISQSSSIARIILQIDCCSDISYHITAVVASSDWKVRPSVLQVELHLTPSDFCISTSSGNEY